MNMNEYLVKRAGAVDITVDIPGSKSYTNRALAIASLAKGTSHLHNFLVSDDTTFMLRALEKLGIWSSMNVAEDTLEIIGGDGHFPAYLGELYVQNAGTAMRFLTSMLTLGKGNYLLSGNERMVKRPIGDLTKALQSIGVNVKARDEVYPPVIIEGNVFPGGSVSMPGTTSSQYISSLLITAPYGQKPLSITIEGDLVSRPYLDMTLDLMRTFGAKAENDDYRVFTVDNEVGYAGMDYRIEPDATNASYFLALPAVVGGRARVNNLSYHNSKQGDVKFVDVLEMMGCDVERGDDYLEVRKDPKKQLKGIEVNLVDMPDVAQTLAVVALRAEGPTNVVGVHNLRVKETDRIEAVATELRTLGANVDEREDGFTVYPKSTYPGGVKIATYDDHRMAMAFSLAGLFIEGVEINNPDCVSKTFPDYFSVLERIYKDPA